ncbi:MAG: CAP domain-containing protein [Oscillospiraceae bacterium]|jgi:hypothetical protein|nr:CAP domain-containing protein [Oscillospiraceae bacterium]
MFALIAALAMLSGVFALPAAAADTGALAADVARLTNEARADDGRTALACTDGKLNAAAQRRAEEIAAKFEHERPDGSSWFTVLAEYGVAFGNAGENIAVGQPRASWAVNAWMKSPGHRSNILGLEVNFDAVGVGVHEREDGTLCWVQLFVSDFTASAAPEPGQASVGGESDTDANGVPDASGYGIADANANGNHGNTDTGGSGGASRGFFAELGNWFAGLWNFILSIFS